MPAHPISPKRRDAALRLYTMLQSAREVAEALGMAAATVRRYAKAAGILRRPGRPRVKTPSVAYIRELHKWYGREQDVADILGISRTTVHNRLTGKGER